MSRAPLLLEIGCEEIPARMIRAAANELARRVGKIFTDGGLGHGDVTLWSGPRRLAVRLEDVAASQDDREELVLGPPADKAFTPEGEPTKAATGFAKKQGVEPGELERHTTDRGEYVGFVKQVSGLSVGRLLAEQLPRAAETMSFPKTMRWGEGRWRWVRPVHWVLALHGKAILELELFGVASGAVSEGHRFLGDGRVSVDHADSYLETLAKAHVVIDRAERRERLQTSLGAAAVELGGLVVEDEALLDEVADLVEWPGTVAGSFDGKFLELPRELLVTTLRHHQKCFSIQNAAGKLMPAFVAVANTDRDPKGNIQRGNEWVIGGRLEDARFFWNEDRRTTLEDRSSALEGVVFHTKIGTFAEKAARLRELAGSIAAALKMDPQAIEDCRRAAFLAKNDLVSGTVGEFPELQGQVGGLLLRAEGASEAVAGGVYGHYLPAGSDDPIPSTPVACVASVADKLDSLSSIIAAGERPSGSRDPYGLRRAGNGILRVLLEAGWSLSLGELLDLVERRDGALAFMRERLVGFFRDRGYSANEIQAAIRPRVGEDEVFSWPLTDLGARLEAIQTVRGREDFNSLVKLTERVDTIVIKNEELVGTMRGDGASGFEETSEAAVALGELVDELAGSMSEQAKQAAYLEMVQGLARLVDPVERFFTDVLVIDKKNPQATLDRYGQLSVLRELLTRYFDIRELAGQAERRAS